MRRPKEGDIVEVPTTLGYFYGLVTHRHDWGDVTRFWKTPYPARPNDLPDFSNPRNLLTKQCAFVGSLDKGEVKIVGHIEIPEPMLKFPLFRSGTANHKTKKVEVWWLWEGKENTRVGELNEEQKKLPRSGACNNAGIVSFLEGKTHPSLL